jgi:hypothetical protein
MLNNRAYFFYNNYSVPQDDPIHTNGTQKQLYQAIYNKIYASGVVIIMAGIYSSYSKWIDNEIYIAKNEFTYPKPILAIEPWGAERTSTVVKENADLIVGWNTESIINGIRQLD